MQRMNFAEMCRTCLYSGGIMCSLFTEDVHQLESEVATVADLLKLFDVQIIANDGFPNQICVGCLAEMNQAYSFKLKCEKSATILRQIRKQKVEKQTRDGFECNNHVNHFEVQNTISFPSHPHSENRIEENNQATIDLTEHELNEEQRLSTSTTETSLHDKNSYGTANAPANSQEGGYENDFPISDETSLQYVKIEPELDIPVEQIIDLDEMQSENHLGGEVSDPQMFMNNFEGSAYRNRTQPPSVYRSQSKLNSNKKPPYYNRPMQTEMGKFLQQRFRFHCSLCTKNLKTKLELDKHLRTHFDESCSCEICSRCKPDKSSLICEICSEVYQTKCKYDDHMRSHSSGETAFTCHICSETFLNRSSLNCHLKDTHDQPTETVRAGDMQCDVCYKVFRTKFRLDEHQRMHTGETPLKCEICFKCFRYEHCLRRHRRNKHKGNY